MVSDFLFIKRYNENHAFDEHHEKTFYIWIYVCIIPLKNRIQIMFYMKHSCWREFYTEMNMFWQWIMVHGWNIKSVESNKYSFQMHAAKVRLLFLLLFVA
jgi:hypothetical protein